jgi:hypothetical protein
MGSIQRSVALRRVASRCVALRRVAAQGNFGPAILLLLLLVGLVFVGLAITSASFWSCPSAFASLPSTTSLMRCIVFSRLLRRVEGEVRVVPRLVWRECPRRHGMPLGLVGVPGVPGLMGDALRGEGPRSNCGELGSSGV